MLKIKYAKSKKVFLAIFLAFIFVASITVVLIPRIHEYFLPDFIKFAGSYEYKFRSLTVNDFKDIKIGDDYSEIVKKVGEPNGEFGSGITRSYYMLNDGSCVIMWFNSNSDRWTELIEIGAIRSNGEGFVLPQWVE